MDIHDDFRFCKIISLALRTFATIIKITEQKKKKNTS